MLRKVFEMLQEYSKMFGKVFEMLRKVYKMLQEVRLLVSKSECLLNCVEMGLAEKESHLANYELVKVALACQPVKWLKQHGLIV